MIRAAIKDFKVEKIIEGNPKEWIISDDIDGKLIATCVSKDCRVTTTYILDKDGEKNFTNSADDEVLRDVYTNLKNDGNGILLLSGGAVSSRFGKFKTSNVHKFMIDNNIDKVKVHSFNGINGLFFIDEDSDICISNNSAFSITHKDANKKVISTKEYITPKFQIKIDTEKDTTKMIWINKADWLIHTKYYWDRKILERVIYLPTSVDIGRYIKQMNSILN